jgi:hypothetical protein
MDYLIDWQPFKTEFRGAKVKMLLRPLKTGAMLMLMPKFESADGDVDKITLNPAEVQEAALEIFPDHVKDITGITVNNGQPVTPQILANESIFYALSMEIIPKLFEISHLSQEQEKNSKRPLRSLPQDKSKVTA